MLWHLTVIFQGRIKSALKGGGDVGQLVKFSNNSKIKCNILNPFPIYSLLDLFKSIVNQLYPHVLLHIWINLPEQSKLIIHIYWFFYSIGLLQFFLSVYIHFSRVTNSLISCPFWICQSFSITCILWYVFKYLFHYHERNIFCYYFVCKPYYLQLLYVYQIEYTFAIRTNCLLHNYIKLWLLNVTSSSCFYYIVLPYYL